MESNNYEIYQANKLKEQLTKEQIKLLKTETPYGLRNLTLTQKSTLKTRRKFIQFLLSKGYSMRAIGLLAHKSPQTISNYSKLKF